MTKVTYKTCWRVWHTVREYSYRKRYFRWKDDMRNLNEIATDIERECREKSWYVYAEAYVTPMKSLSNLTQSYGADSAESIVLYALSNLTYWRGDTARKCKAELKEHLDSYAKAQKVVNA